MKRKAEQAAEGPIAKAAKHADQNVRKNESRSDEADPGAAHIPDTGQEEGAAGKEQRRDSEEAEASTDSLADAGKQNILQTNEALADDREPSRRKRQGNEEVEAQTPRHEPKPNAKGKEHPRRKKHAAENPAETPVEPAQELLDQLVVAAELRRSIQHRTKQYQDTRGAARVKLVTVLLQRRLSEHLHRLCQLAIIPSMSSEPSLEPIPEDWFSLMKSLHDAQGTTIRHATSTTDVQEEIIKLLNSIDADFVRRTSVLIDASDDDPWPEEAAELEEEIGRTYGRLEDLEERLAGLTAQLDDLRNRETALREVALEQADSVLVGAGLLEALEEPAAEGDAPDQQHRPSAESAARSEQNARRPSDPPDVPPARPAWNARTERYPPDEEGRTARRNMPDKGWRKRSASMPNLRDRLKADTLADMHQAERAWSQASRDFHNTRTRYPTRLQEFLEAREEGAVKGTKTEFDAQYYIARGKANRKYAKAESDYEHARKAAQMVGALPERLVSSDFADRVDDGYLDSELALDEIQRMDAAAIDRWRRDEKQKEIENESDWLSELVSVDPADRSIAAESSESQDRYAGAKRQKLLDRWRVEQEGHRLREENRRQDRMRAGSEGSA